MLFIDEKLQLVRYITYFAALNHCVTEVAKL